jgi:hypothetical protein
MADAWVPVDHLLAAATEEMASGQLIHDDAFSLFNSMSAIQIMDRKMDVGMAPPPGEPPHKSTRQLIAEAGVRHSPRVGTLGLALEGWHSSRYVSSTNSTACV